MLWHDPNMTALVNIERPSRNRLPVLAVVLAVVVAFVATACSSSTATTTTTSASVSDDQPATEATEETDTEGAGSEDAEGGAEGGADSEPTETPVPTAAPTATAAPAPTAEPPEEPESSSSGFASDEDFCRVARELDENDPFEDAELDPFSPEFFEAAGDIYDSLVAIAPDAIRDDIEAVRDELSDISEQLEAIDYDFTDPAFGEVMQSLDSGGIDQAAVRIEAYLSEACGIEAAAGEDFDAPELDADDIPALGLDEDALAALGSIGPEEAALLLGQLGLDPDLQACLFEKLPELTASQDPAILTQEICGTTLLEIVSGLTG